MSTRDQIPEFENDASRSWSSSEWQDWVTRKIDERRQIYATDPDEMVAAYLRETGTAQDYRGRELLELLQNADDAGGDGGGECRAAIVLTERGLCVANTGTVFSAAGVKSLMLTNNSPKRYQRARYIGNKGLGFRSILEWTTSPFILSGNLKLAFSQSFAKAWLEQLCRESADVCRKVEMERLHGAAHPISLLALPVVGLSVAGAGEDLTLLHQEALSLQDEGYDTIVGIPFSTARAYNEAAEQFDLIDRDVLLFTRNLREVRLARPGSTATWEVERGDELVEIKPPGRPPEIWQVFATRDDIPQHHLRSDQHSTPEYEIKVAVPTEHVHVSGFLFSYFVTQVRLPLPVVVHATVELTHNRKNLVESPANRYLVDRIASFIGEIAEHHAIPTDPWNALSVLAAEGPFDPVLEKFGLPKKLVAAARSLPIVPVRSGNLVHRVAARRPHVAGSAWLPREGFEDVVQTPPTSALAALLNKLDIPELTSAEMGARLDQLSAGLTLDARVSLLAGLIGSNALPTPPPRLLIDDGGTLLPLDEPTFLPPGDDDPLPLPTWARVHLLSRELTIRLRAALSIASQRDLMTRLAGFKVREYGFAPIVSAVHAATNDRVKHDPAREAEHRAELLRALLALLTREVRTGQPVSPPDIRVILLRTRAGTFAPATSLYLGAEYPRGRLTDALYHANPERLVASPETLGMQAGASVIEGLLTWLGVESLPRKTTLRAPASFTHFATRILQYPVIFDRGGFIAHSPAELQRVSLDVSSVDGLDAILAKADPHAIVAWLDQDHRLEEWRSGDADASLQCLPSGARKPRVLIEQVLPSFVSWLIETTAWVPTARGAKAKPAYCTMDPSLPEEMQRLLCPPALQAGHPLFRSLRMDERRVRSALERAGVRPSLHLLSWDDFYGLLLELPRIDPDGRSARPVYRALFRRADGDEPKGATYERFRAEGKLWGSLAGTAGYFRTSELYYDDNGIIPTPVRSLLPLFQFDRRRGAHRVERLFGVTPLHPAKVVVSVDSIRKSPRSAELCNEIERLKPFIYVVRTFTDTQGTALARLRKLDVQLCESISGRATIGNNGYAIALSAPGEVLLVDGTAYLIAGATNLSPLLKDELLADAVGELFAALFQIENGGDFARLASCTEERRTALLARVLGVEVAEGTQLIVAARTSLKQSAEPPGSSASPWVEPPTDGKSTTPAPAQGEGIQDNGRSLALSTVTPAPPSSAAAATSAGKTGLVTAVAQPRPVLPPPRAVRFRVCETPHASPSGTSSAQRPVVDPVRCQQLAAAFEEAEGQGRFPLPVDHLQGSDAYGCDVLSFASAEDRERFRACADIRLVVRFIEVKGRGHENGRVELRGNELRAARRHKERFFVYRVYECRNGEFEIALLSDPTTTDCDVVYEIDVSRSATVTFWRVVEVGSEAKV